MERDQALELSQTMNKAINEFTEFLNTKKVSVLEFEVYKAVIEYVTKQAPEMSKGFQNVIYEGVEKVLSRESIVLQEEIKK